MMQKIMTKVSICAAAVIMSIGIIACSGSSGGGKDAGDVFTKTYTALYDETEELVDTVPMAPVSSAYTESMMQVSGYTYTFKPADETNYEFTVVQECGQPGDDSEMYLKRTFIYKGSYTADGDTYTLQAPEHMNFSQESAGQFAATSGEGGADTWGPDGLEFDEAYQNEEGYGMVRTGAEYLADMSGCKVTVSGTQITAFELVQ